MEQKQLIIQYCRQFKTTGISSTLDNLINKAENGNCGYLEFTLNLLKAEATHRHNNEVHRRRKAARLPHRCDLSRYDHSFSNGLSKSRLNQLRELNWMDQVFNIMLTGPSGTGKTFLGAGLCADAIEKGHKAYFRTMEELN